MATGGRWISFGVVLLLAAAAAYFFAGEANRPAPIDQPSGAEPSAPAPSSAEAPALAGRAPPSPAAGAPTSRPEPPSPAPSGRQVRLLARAVLAKGVPSPGASATMRIGERVALEATADADGRVRFVVDRPDDENEYGLLLVRDAEGRLGQRVVPWRTGPPGGVRTTPSEIDFGDVFLLPTHAIEIFVHETSGVAAEAEVWVAPRDMVTTAPLARGRTDAKGRGRMAGLPAGTLYVVAYVPGRARGGAFAVVPRDSPDPLEIVLDPLRDVVVTVEERGTHAPIAGATVTLTETLRAFDYGTDAAYVPPPTIPPTGADGRTTIAAIAAKARLGVTASAPGFATEETRRFSGSAAPSAPDVTTITVSLARRRRIVWPVVEGEVPPPPEGTTLRLRPSVGSGSSEPSGDGRMEGGRLVADGFGPGPVHMVAAAPDGSTARLFAGPERDEGLPTKFFRARRIDVRLTWTDGTPAEGLTVTLRNQGNNPMGAPIVTDAAGRATLADLEVQQVDVYASRKSEDLFGGRRVGTCDLAAGDGRVEVSLPRPREVLVRVWTDGTPGLPDGFRTAFALFADGIIERDEAKGLVRLRVWPANDDAPVPLQFEAPGWLMDEVKAPAPSGPGAVEVRVEARRAGSLRVDVVRPKDGRMRLSLEKWDPGREDWVAAGYDSQSFGQGQAQVDAEGRWGLRTLAAGRYRVRERYSGALSAEIDVAAGAEPTRVRFDLSGVGYVTGRVVVPEGESPARVTVRRSDVAPVRNAWEQAPGSTTTDSNGDFRLRLPGDREYEILPEHLLLGPAADGGRARVRAGATDVVLRMAKGPVARVRFDREPRYSVNPGEARTERYFLWKGPRAGAPAAEGRVQVVGTTATFANFEPGRCTVMIDLLPCAPLVLEDVDLGAGETDLGTVALSDGSSLVFEVRVPAGQTAPRVSVGATFLGDPPRYSRWGEIGANGRIPGLGKGRFHVVAFPMMGGAILYDREIEVDGATDVRIVIDLK